MTRGNRPRSEHSRVIVTLHDHIATAVRVGIGRRILSFGQGRNPSASSSLGALPRSILGFQFAFSFDPNQLSSSMCLLFFLISCLTQRILSFLVLRSFLHHLVIRYRHPLLQRGPSVTRLGRASEAPPTHARTHKKPGSNIKPPK